MVTGYEAGFYRAVDNIDTHLRSIDGSLSRIADALERIAVAVEGPGQQEAMGLPPVLGADE